MKDSKASFQGMAAAEPVVTLSSTDERLGEALQEAVRSPLNNIRDIWFFRGFT